MKTIAWAMLAALPILNGCAACGNLGSNECKAYGGTQLDASLVSEGVAPQSELDKKGLERPVVVWAACCGMADLPLSFVADTVMLPVALTRQGTPAPAPNPEPASNSIDSVDAWVPNPRDARK